ncbi:MAG TPA: carboxypeptidase-like regulatory domain-containing protein [Nitrospiria bacterium]|jgi:hypothetical protein|nr:carboxypeptidase-like regulatory domain-containing protein [Nitrospiria bacterium]
MKGFIIAIVMAGVVGLMSASMVSAYDEAPVPDGGTITGKISFKGAVPAPKEFDFAKFPNPKFCEQADSDGKGHRLVQQVNVKNGALADVVVFIEEIEKGKPFKFNGTDVKTNICRFQVQGGPSTLTGVVVKKAEIRILNTDADPNDPKAATGVLHNPHAYEMVGASSSTIFNLPLPEKGQVIKKPMILRKKESDVKIQCDQHNYMEVYFQPVTNPYYAIDNEDGTFAIDDVPPGTYELHAYHPILGTQEVKVTVPAKGKATADFTFAAK